MKNSNTFAISILLLCLMLLACNFKFGETAGDNTNKEIKQINNSDEKTELKKVKKKTDDASTESDSTLPRRLGGYKYRYLDYSIYQVPKNLSEDELLKIAQKLHDEEPNSILILADTDDADEYIDFYERLEKGETGMEYPREWEIKHIVGGVNIFLINSEKKWFLTKESLYEKVTELQ